MLIQLWLKQDLSKNYFLFHIFQNIERIIGENLFFKFLKKETV